MKLCFTRARSSFPSHLGDQDQATLCGEHSRNPGVLPLDSPPWVSHSPHVGVTRVQGQKLRKSLRT